MTALPIAARIPAARIRRLVLPLALCAGLATGLTACAEDPDEGTNGVGKLDPGAIEQKAQTAADAAKAVRLAGTLVSKGGTFKLNMRLKDDGASGSVVTKNSTFELLRIGDALYMKADAAFWAHDDEGGGDSGGGDGSGGGSSTASPSEADSEAADKLDDKYVKVPQDDPSYKQLRGFTDMDLLLDGLIGLHGEVVKGDRDKIGGIRTVKVKGGEDGEGGTLDVALEGTPFPLQFARGGGAGVVVLSDWNKDFPLEAPAPGETLDYGKQLPRT
ncbi:hypothetical protein M5362_20070 [Streptomyces sp. Je 1-79]|uniref:hypothetical protein n=1 Tax=Streptomyces sp. Je 1-79 TaxID=2943847 RepID=UPI0021A630E0|nr:hypothetical protein [Streptomyces sp. Je 1-79]MCT4355435.1 hypothetical protein [Streptomyces sp. Je 1-79]